MNVIVTMDNHGSLLELYPHIAAEWDYERNEDLSPSGVLPHSNKYVWWKCKEGHEWYAKINNRTSKNTMCPYCAHKLPIKGANDFASLYPSLLEEWDFEKNALDPTEVFPQSNKRVAWKCNLGHEWKARIDHSGNVKKCAVGKYPKSEKHGNTAQFSEVERSGTQENCGVHPRICVNLHDGVE